MTPPRHANANQAPDSTVKRVAWGIAGLIAVGFVLLPAIAWTGVLG